MFTLEKYADKILEFVKIKTYSIFNQFSLTKDFIICCKEYVEWIRGQEKKIFCGLPKPWINQYEELKKGHIKRQFDQINWALDKIEDMVNDKNAHRLISAYYLGRMDDFNIYLRHTLTIYQKCIISILCYSEVKQRYL